MEKGRTRGEAGLERDGKRSRGSREKGAAPARNFGPAAIAAGGRGRADAGKEKSSVTSRKSSARRGGNARRVAREKKNWGGEGVSGWLRGQEEGGKCARAVEEGALSLRAPLSAGSTPLLSSSFLSTDFSLSTSRLSSPPPFFASDRLRVRPRSRTSIVYTAAALFRLLFLRWLGWINPSLSISLFPSLSFISIASRLPSLSLSLSLSLCLFRLFFPLAAPLSSRLCPFHVSRRGGGGGGEEKVGKEEEGEQWD